MQSVVNNKDYYPVASRWSYIYDFHNKYMCFQSSTAVYFLTYWRQVPVVRPSSGHLYIKFKKFKPKKLNKLKNYGMPYDMELMRTACNLYLNFM
jgi:hypothetical protein